MGAMQKLFISYRRSDTRDITERIYDWLTLRMSREDVFRDIGSVPPGANFVQTITDAVAQCQTLLVIIGPEWLAEVESLSDYVMLEVETALRHNLRIIPILVSGVA